LIELRVSVSATVPNLLADYLYLRETTVVRQTIDTVKIYVSSGGHSSIYWCQQRLLSVTNHQRSGGWTIDFSVTLEFETSGCRTRLRAMRGCCHAPSGSPEFGLTTEGGARDRVGPTRSIRAAMKSEPSPPMTLRRRLFGAGPAIITPFDAVPKALTSQPLILFRRICIAAP
jgi:hypothetical protein